MPFLSLEPLQAVIAGPNIVSPGDFNMPVDEDALSDPGPLRKHSLRLPRSPTWPIVNADRAAMHSVVHWMATREIMHWRQG